MTTVKYWVGFSLIPGIGRVRLGLLENHFGNLEAAWRATPSELQTAGLDSRSLQSMITRRPEIDLDAEMEKLERHQIKVLIRGTPSYPKRLNEIYDAPPILYLKGTMVPEDEWALAVIGTRRATSYGREITQALVSDLVRNSLTIVSGLARGIDSIAHTAALKAGGRTIAVLACGLDIVYPPENQALAREIVEDGALVSDYPLGTKPKAENFPQRNRILSGLSLGVLVTESMETGGALITANMALQQDREVFAVPGSILSPASRGTNRLIQAGAKTVLEVNDILEELNLTMVPQQMEFRELTLSGAENDTERCLLQHLSGGALHIDELSHRSCLPVSTVSSALTIMELKGIVRHLGNMNYGAV